MSGAVEARLAELGITLPEVVPPLAAYQPAVRSGAYVFTSGQLPMVDGKLPATGKVGSEVSPERAKELARWRRSARSSVTSTA
jgi:enamine deaminase RidA (YjgF/YER057c/UK114 family)